ncbi:MAG: 3-dehydro-L-gulonate 2-dehydrogenase [Spirochaetales bacterium]|nr:3-dehydro-L-gulonate 2-dehydrogenase [Spirochaetales bacterium]
MRVSYDEMYKEFIRVLNKYGIEGKDAELSAKLFADASRDGVYTHGLNRFPKFIKSIENGSVDVTKRAVKTASFGALERWDGQKGPGNLNAYMCMERAIELAKENTVGVVGLSNTNHWMRPGNYGIQATDKDCIAILWTNTVPNMPAWGGKDAKLGNNPIVLAVPHKDNPVILDVAMSMFSYGKLEKLKMEGKDTPVDGGYNIRGEVTRKPEEILETHQVFPIGFWKGSGLSLLLDLIASSVAGGRTSRGVGELDTETSLSQFFLAIDLSRFPDRERIDEEIEKTLEDLRSSIPMDEAHPVHAPGDGMKKTRKESMEKGIFVDEEVWKKVLEL